MNNEICWYLNEWLETWNSKFLSNWGFEDDKPLFPRGTEPNFEIAKLNSETLSDLLAIDAIKSSL